MTTPAIQHAFDAQGGFLVADFGSGITAYAYPGSIHATDAKTNPARVAAEMLDHERSYTRSALALDYDARNRDTLRALLATTAEA